MSQTSLPREWLELLFDPYAVLGISVNADERLISKRYHAIAKLLHPDNYSKTHKPDQELAKAIFTSLINPAYEQLKQTKQRLSVMAVLRLEARELEQRKSSSFRESIATQLMPMSAQEAELFYEDAIASYAKTQYKYLHPTYHVIKNLNTLNLVYLWLHKSDAHLLPTEPTAIIPQAGVQPVELTLSEKKDVKPVLTIYAQRHYERAIEYTKQANCTLAVQELRDAIKLDPNNSDYHALLGVVHYQQQFLGMARVYFRQALKLNPQHPLALRYAAKMKINPGENAKPQSMAKALGIAALLSTFLFKKR